MGFPGGSHGKESACNAGDSSLIPGLGRFSGGGHVNQLQYTCLENPHGQRSLAGCSPWGCKELDKTKPLSTHPIHGERETNFSLTASSQLHLPFICGLIQFSSVQFSRSVLSYSLQPCESQHARPPCPSPTPGVHSDSRPSSQ